MGRPLSKPPLYPPPYSLDWLPPLSLGRPLEPGGEIPIKFTVRNVDGEFVSDDSVEVVIAGEDGEIVLRVIGKNGGVEINRDDGYYVTNWPTRKDMSGTYIVSVYFMGISLAHVAIFF